MNFGDPKDMSKDEGALYSQVQALLQQQQQQAVAAQQIQVSLATDRLLLSKQHTLCAVLSEC